MPGQLRDRKRGGITFRAPDIREQGGVIMDIKHLTAAGLGRKIQAGDVSVREAVEAALAQIDQVEGDVHGLSLIHI